MATSAQVAAALQQGANDALGAPAAGNDLGCDQATAGVVARLAVDLPGQVQSVLDAINAAAQSIVAAIEALPHHGN